MQENWRCRFGSCQVEDACEFIQRRQMNATSDARQQQNDRQNRAEQNARASSSSKTCTGLPPKTRRRWRWAPRRAGSPPMAIGSKLAGSPPMAMGSKSCFLRHQARRGVHVTRLAFLKGKKGRAWLLLPEPTTTIFFNSGQRSRRAQPSDERVSSLLGRHKCCSRVSAGFPTSARGTNCLTLVSFNQMKLGVNLVQMVGPS